MKGEKTISLGKTIHLGNEDSTKNDLNLFLPLPFLDLRVIMGPDPLEKQDKR